MSLGWWAQVFVAMTLTLLALNTLFPHHPKPIACIQYDQVSGQYVWEVRP